MVIFMDVDVDTVDWNDKKIMMSDVYSDEYLIIYKSSVPDLIKELEKYI